MNDFDAHTDRPTDRPINPATNEPAERTNQTKPNQPSLDHLIAARAIRCAASSVHHRRPSVTTVHHSHPLRSPGGGGAPWPHGRTDLDRDIRPRRAVAEVSEWQGRAERERERERERGDSHSCVVCHVVRHVASHVVRHVVCTAVRELTT